jgi:hypothetical protein
VHRAVVKTAVVKTAEAIAAKAGVMTVAALVATPVATWE